MGHFEKNKFPKCDFFIWPMNYHSPAVIIHIFYLAHPKMWCGTWPLITQKCYLDITQKCHQMMSTFFYLRVQESYPHWVMLTSRDMIQGPKGQYILCSRWIGNISFLGTFLFFIKFNLYPEGFESSRTFITSGIDHSWLFLSLRSAKAGASHSASFCCKVWAEEAYHSPATVSRCLAGLQRDE